MTFYFSIEGDSISVKNSSNLGIFEIATVKRYEFQMLSWFSVGSKNALAHWTFFCSPEGLYTMFMFFTSNNGGFAAKYTIFTLFLMSSLDSAFNYKTDLELFLCTSS